ncbi:MAG: PD40 domain-containing protein [Verrucomicrobiales bacterium]|nr:PD40 domain-containing protein [Verrucomicrobiales bacterium]
MAVGIASLWGDCLARAQTANVWAMDTDPFVARDARVLAGFEVPDWTSAPSALPGDIEVTAERRDSSGLFVDPARRVLGLAPAGATYVLVNQVAPDIAVFGFSGRPAPIGGGDLDGNGMDDVWEAAVFGRTGADPDADPDGDGFSNLAEFEAGTDPARPESRPVLEGVVGWWRGEEDARDSAGSHHGVWSGASSYEQGRFGRALTFGVDRFVEVPASVDLRPAAGLTVAAWVRWRELPPNGSPVMAIASTTPGIPALALRLTSAGPRLQLSSAFATTIEGPQIGLAPGVWYHVAASWDGAAIRFYLNGKPAWATATRFANPPAYGDGAGLRIGRDDAGAVLDGAVDELVLANRALGEAAIRALAGGNSGPRGKIGSDAILVERSDQTAWRLGADGTGARFLTCGSGFRLSLDGTRLLFRRSAFEPGAAAGDRLWVRDLIRGSEEPGASIEDSANLVSFDWGNDGTIWLALGRRGEIGRIAAGGAGYETVMGAERSEGVPLALTVSRATGRLAWFNQGLSVAQWRPWTASGSGGDAAPIPGTSVADAGSEYRFPAWSPDGTRLAFKRGAALVALASEGSDLVVLAEGPDAQGSSRFHDVTPVWTADGQQLVSVASATGQGPSTWLVAVGTNGGGAVLPMEVEGAPVERVVYAGAFRPGQGGEPRIEWVWVPPVGGLGQARLEVVLDAEAPAVVLEGVENLGGAWRVETPLVRDEAGKRVLSVPIDLGVKARFFRLRR